MKRRKLIFYATGETLPEAFYPLIRYIVSSYPSSKKNDYVFKINWKKKEEKTYFNVSLKRLWSLYPVLPKMKERFDLYSNHFNANQYLKKSTSISSLITHSANKRKKKARREFIADNRYLARVERKKRKALFHAWLLSCSLALKHSENSHCTRVRGWTAQQYLTQHFSVVPAITVLYIYTDVTNVRVTITHIHVGMG